MAHTPTIGVDFRSKVIEVPLRNRSDKKRIKLQLWDTAGQERFRTLTDTYFKGASGIVIVYAVDDRRSFEDVSNWMVQLEQNGASRLPKLIVGNKCDLREERKVGAEEGRILADECKCTFMEVSAKENINIEQMFSQLALAIASDIKEELTGAKGS
jgi:small GTP-binding protein